MITGTVLVVVFAPLFYVLIEKVFGKRGRREAAKAGGAKPFFRGLMEKFPGKRRKLDTAGKADTTPMGDA
jgi:peptidoglycan/LPS O-acetylase OafA/YrhL